MIGKIKDKSKIKLNYRNDLSELSCMHQKIKFANPL